MGVTGFNLVMWNIRERKAARSLVPTATQPRGYGAPGLSMQSFQSPGSLGHPHPEVPGDLNGVYTRLLTVDMSFRLSESKMQLVTGLLARKSPAPCPQSLVFHEPRRFLATSVLTTLCPSLLPGSCCALPGQSQNFLTHRAGTG